MIDKTLLNINRINNRPTSGNLTTSKQSKVDDSASASTGKSDVEISDIIQGVVKRLVSEGPDNTRNVEDISNSLTGRGYQIDHQQLADNLLDEYLNSK